MLWRRPGKRDRAAALLALLGYQLAGLLSAPLVSPGNPFGMFQMAAWVLFAHTPLFLVGLAVILFKQRRGLAVVLLVAAAMVVAIAVDAFLIEPFHLEITSIELTSDRVREPLKVAVIADLQSARPGRYEAGVLAAVAAGHPDLVLLAGDYLHVNDRHAYRAAAAELRSMLQQAGLTAPLGAFAVRGNVDAPGHWRRIFTDTPVVTAETSTRFDLGPVVLTALALEDSFDPQATVTRGTDKLHIVLGHSPNFSLGRIEADLLIAGHTHGGQVQLPGIGPLITLSQVPRQWAHGATEIAPGKLLVVSRGIGMERGQAPQLRFLCRPELIFIEVSGPQTPTSQ
jgi:predicted MPP superfamily phosphohydrolase